MAEKEEAVNEQIRIDYNDNKYDEIATLFSEPGFKFRQFWVLET